MNIGILIPGFSDGEQDWCIPVYLNLVQALAQTDRVRVFALRYPPRRDHYMVYGAQVHAIGGHSSTARVRRWLLLARTVAMVIRQHRQKPFDVLHAIWADETGFAACVAGKLIGVPVVVSVAGGELVALPGYGLQSGRISRWLVRQALTHADCITAPCQYAANLTRQILTHPNKMRIVPLGVDTTLFRPRSIPKITSVPRLLAVGSLSIVKGHDRLLEALACLPGVSLDIVGEGPLLPQLRAQAAKLGIAERVIFHGAVTHDTLPRFYQEATLHILTSQHEAFGMVVIEAAACGLPTVGFALGVLPELSDFAGIAVPPNDMSALVAAIQSLLSDPARRSAMSNAARQLVEARYTVAAMRDGMRQAYLNAINGRSTVPRLR